MKWDEAYSCIWKIIRMDSSAWMETSEYLDAAEGDSFSISKDATDSVPLILSGSVSIKVPLDYEFEPGWYKIVLTTQQNGKVERHPIAVLLLDSPGGTFERSIQSMTLNGYSVLKPASDRKLPVGTYAPKGVDGPKYCLDLLEKSGPAPVTIDSNQTFTLADHIVFDSGMSYLEAIWMILDSAEWCIQLDGDGTIHLLPKPTTSEFTFNIAAESYFGNTFSYDRDLANVPNRYYATDGYFVASAVNEDPESPTSYQARGNRWIDLVDTAPALLNGETLDGYARRMLVSESTIFKTFSYSREYIPGLEPFDIISCNRPNIGMTEDVRIMSQSLTCGKGIFLNETAGIEEQEFSY